MSRANRRRRYRRRHRTGLAQAPRGTLVGSLCAGGRVIGRVWITSMALRPLTSTDLAPLADPSPARGSVEE